LIWSWLLNLRYEDRGKEAKYAKQQADEKPACLVTVLSADGD
jgi:hypothetical protein